MTPEQLPGPAAGKFRSLAFAAADAEALANSTLQAMELARGRLGDAMNQVDSASDDSRRDRAKENVESIQRQLEVLKEVFARRQSEHGAAQQVIAQCEYFLGRLPPETRLEMVETSGPVVPLLPGETVVQGLDRIRKEISEVEAELAQIKRTPWTRLELREMAADQVALRVRKGRPRLRSTLKEGLVIQYGHPQAWSAGNIEELVDTLCWYDPEQFLERIFREIDVQCKTDGGLSGPEREQRIKQLTADLDRLQRSEEAMVEVASVPRRLGASPQAILGVRVVSSRQEVAA